MRPLSLLMIENNEIFIKEINNIVSDFWLSCNYLIEMVRYFNLKNFSFNQILIIKLQINIIFKFIHRNQNLWLENLYIYFISSPFVCRMYNLILQIKTNIKVNEIVLCTFIYIIYHIINILFHSKLLLSILYIF